jgi:hypothetical protein
VTRARIAALITLVVYALSACSPGQITAYVYGANQGYHVEAAPVADDGGGSMFWSAIVCAGEGFWREGAHINVDNAPNTAGGRFVSEVTCPSGRTVVATSIGRGRS